MRSLLPKEIQNKRRGYGRTLSARPPAEPPFLLEKLEEMAEVTPDAFDDLQGYAVLCSAMAEVCNAITQKA